MSKRMQPLRVQHGADGDRHSAEARASDDPEASALSVSASRLPPVDFRAARIAKHLCQAAGTPLALIEVEDSNGPVIHTAPLCTTAFAERVGVEWRAPNAPGSITLYDGIGSERADFATGACAPIMVGGRRGWAAALAPAGDGSEDASQAEATAALVAELAAELGAQARAHDHWHAHLQAEINRHERFHTLAALGTLSCKWGEDALDASPIAYAALRTDALNCQEDLLACFAPHDRNKLRAMLRPGNGEEPFTRNLHIDTNHRDLVTVRLRVDFTFDEEGVPSGWIGTVEDVSEDQAELAGIRQMAERDPLTGAHNRLHFEKALDNATELAQSRRELAGLILVNLDDFRGLVQNHGHLVGDAVLRYCARALTNLVRSTDTVVRLSGDEFAVILSSTNDDDGLHRRASLIHDTLSTEVTVGDELVPITASVGVAIYPHDTIGGVDLFKAASYALLEAGRPGAPDVVRYTRSIQDRREAERLFIEEVRRALSDQQFEPFFQPKVDLESGAIVGFEALCRWRHPQRGVLTPGAFWAALDSPVVGVDLSNVSLAGAFRAAERFSKLGLDFGHIAINLSGRQLAQREVLNHIAELQERHHVSAGQITFEVLENVLIREQGAVRDNLNGLADLGFTIALDDFGTGFASLTHIREPFIREVKIDRSFITNAGANPSSQKIVAAIVQMARKLRLRMVAEGIEDEETLRKLRAIGCTVGQGFVFSPALPLDEAEEFLGRQNRIAALLRGLPPSD